MAVKMTREQRQTELVALMSSDAIKVKEIYRAAYGLAKGKLSSSGAPHNESMIDAILRNEYPDDSEAAR